MVMIAGSGPDAPPMLQRNFILRTNKSTNQRTLVSRLIVLRNVRQGLEHALISIVPHSPLLPNVHIFAMSVPKIRAPVVG